jgi:hypothetical protein
MIKNLSSEGFSIKKLTDCDQSQKYPLLKMETAVIQ